MTAPTTLPAELRALAHRAAHVPGGLALVDQAPVETAATLLGVTPAQVLGARAQLHDADARARLQDEMARAPAEAAPPPAPPAPADAAALLALAQRDPARARLLREAAPEAAAVALGVPPALVLQARALGARGG